MKTQQHGRKQGHGPALFRANSRQDSTAFQQGKEVAMEVPTSEKMLLTIPEAVALTGIERAKFYEYRDREVDPLPCYLEEGKRKQVKVFRDDLEKWLRQHMVPYRDAGQPREGRRR